MKKLTKVLALVLALVMVAAVFAGCGEKPAGGDSGSAEGMIAPLSVKKIYGDEEIKIAHVALSTMGITNILVQKALDEQCSLYPNIKVEYFDAMYDVNKQISLIEEAVNQGFSAILCEPLDTEACNKAIGEAEAAGVPVITINCGATVVHSLHMQGSDYKAGWMAGENLAKATSNKGKAVVLDCPAEMKAIGLMGKGFEEYVKQNTEIEVLENQSVPMWSTENANTIMRDMLTKYAEIDMVYCASDDIALGAVQAIEAAGRQDEGILVWGNCGYRPALEAIYKGQMYGTCYSDVYVQYATAFYMALNLIATGTTALTAGYNETPIVDQVMLPCTKDNVLEFMQVSRWFSPEEFIAFAK